MVLNPFCFIHGSPVRLPQPRLFTHSVHTPSFGRSSGGEGRRQGITTGLRGAGRCVFDVLLATTLVICPRSLLLSDDWSLELARTLSTCLRPRDIVPLSKTGGMLSRNICKGLPCLKFDFCSRTKELVCEAVSTHRGSIRNIQPSPPSAFSEKNFVHTATAPTPPPPEIDLLRVVYPRRAKSLARGQWGAVKRPQHHLNYILLLDELLPQRRFCQYLGPKSSDEPDFLEAGGDHPHHQGRRREKPWGKIWIFKA